MGQTTMGQKLARTVGEGTSIDPSSGTEYTKSVEPVPFWGSIARFASDKKEETLEARRHTDKPGEMFFWTDRSRLNLSHTGARVAWCS